jgi:hypothetical protein
MARPSKPASVIKLEGKSHRTKKNYGTGSKRKILSFPE